MAQVQEIASYSPDLVALQEVAIRHPKGKPVDYPAAAARELNMNYLFANAFDLGENSYYGVALLSKFPMEKVAEIMLPVPENIEPRIALVAKVNAPQPFYAVSTHLSYQGEFEGDEEGRAVQIKTVLDFLEKNSLYPAILAGDLNATPDTAALNALRENFTVLSDGREEMLTANSTKYGWVQIDYISLSKDGTWHCDSLRKGKDCTVSDHYAVIAELTLD
jgi:endonuclease/exonuclease/phosphatase family metal-dependent hydrolase